MGILIASLDVMLLVALILRGLINMRDTAETIFDEFKGNDCIFVAGWLKIFNKTDLYLFIFKYVKYIKIVFTI